MKIRVFSDSLIFPIVRDLFSNLRELRVLHVISQNYILGCLWNMNLHIRIIWY